MPPVMFAGGHHVKSVRNLVRLLGVSILQSVENESSAQTFHQFDRFLISRSASRSPNRFALYFRRTLPYLPLASRIPLGDFFAMHHPSPAQSNDPTNEIIDRLRALGMRKTTALTQVLDALASSTLPLTISEISDRLADGSRCDPATIYRMLEKLERARVVRKLGMHERAMYFELLRPDHHGDYLLCTSCGKITKIPAACPVGHLEDHLRSESGYRNLTHELVFYGICPDCPEDA